MVAAVRMFFVVLVIGLVVGGAFITLLTGHSEYQAGGIIAAAIILFGLVFTMDMDEAT